MTAQQEIAPETTKAFLLGKCLETLTDLALKPAHVLRMLNIRDPFSENVAKAADHGNRQLYFEEPAQSAGLVVGSVETRAGWLINAIVARGSILHWR